MSKECGLCHCSEAWNVLNKAGLCVSCWETVNWFSMRSTN